MTSIRRYRQTHDHLDAQLQDDAPAHVRARTHRHAGPARPGRGARRLPADPVDGRAGPGHEGLRRPRDQGPRPARGVEHPARPPVAGRRHLRILSGLSGVLGPCDGIGPYRLEMGYRLPRGPYANLYTCWGTAIAEQLPAKGRIVNLAANEYSRTVVPHVEPARVVTPRFLT